MTFVFPVLLGGLVLAGVPVLLHLIMRQKPRLLRFPAFRFLVQRHRTNLRKLRLRHLILLALRILLIVAICLALTRPRLFHHGSGLSSERPVAAVLIFDTSPSMDYKTSDGITRLDDAKKRGLELLDELPEESRVVILDTAAAAQSARGDWISKSLARERIAALKVEPNASPVNSSLEHAYRLLADMGRKKDDDVSRFLPRFVCVFSDRTRAAFDMSRQQSVLETGDQVPSALEGLQRAHETIAPLTDRLRELRAKIPPPPGSDFPDQALLDFLDQLRDRLPTLTREDMPPDEKLTSLVNNIQRRGRDMLALLRPKDDQPADTDDYRARLIKNLEEMLANLRGAQGLFLDVGVESPIDLALLQLELPKLGGQTRQVFAEDEKILLNAVVRATGKDFSTTLLCKVGKKTLQQALEIKAGETKAVPFEIDLGELKLAPGQHQLEVRFATPDLLAFNNQRYLTFAIREARKVLVLADDPEKASYFKWALEALKFSVEVKKPAEALKLDKLLSFQGIYLFGVPAPDATLWAILNDYVSKGGGLGIVPGGEEMKIDAYTSPAAEKLMPGSIGRVLTQGKDQVKPGAYLNLDEDSIYQHPLLAPIRAYKGDNAIDFNRFPSNAYRFWEVKPRKDAGSVLVRYNDPEKSPALLERRLVDENRQAGKVLLFTTPLDARNPRWNDYLEGRSSFYLVIVSLSTNYLVGESEPVHLNFITAQGEPVVTLPLTPRFPAYALQGPGILEQITAPEGNRLSVKLTLAPGNYVVDGVANDAKGSRRVAAFSVNLPGEESDLSRVPAAEIETVSGSGSVVPIDRKTGIRDVLRGHWSEPLELFPFLMVLLLLVLAVENLLANKFYRRENVEDEQVKST